MLLKIQSYYKILIIKKKKKTKQPGTIILRRNTQIEHYWSWGLSCSMNLDDKSKGTQIPVEIWKHFTFSCEIPWYFFPLKPRILIHSVIWKFSDSELFKTYKDTTLFLNKLDIYFQLDAQSALQNWGILQFIKDIIVSLELKSGSKKI